MTDVQFEEDMQASGGSKSILYGRFVPSTQAPKLVSLVVKWGIAKDTKGANNILLGLALVAFLITVFLIARMTFLAPGTTPTTYREDLLPGVFDSLPADVKQLFPSRNE